jgi:endoglucanase
MFVFATECPVAPSVEGPVSYYGKLKVREGRPFIEGVKEGRENNIWMQVRGVSFFWSQWGSSFYNANAVERLAKDWKAEIVRVAYGQDNAANKQTIKTVIDAAIENDVYIIIDWHSHTAHNQTVVAQDFFAEMAQIYGQCDGVIFELYNEPTSVDWAGIKNYAEQVIPVIRNHSENLILVGTPSYSQRIQDVVGKAIDDINVGYVVHFYAASHRLSNWQNDIDAAWQSGLPIFVTEYGTTSADGGCSPTVSGSDCKNGDQYNSHNAARSDEWHSYMDSRKISSVAWSVFDKYEGSAFFGTVPNGTFDQAVENWADTEKMTASGKYIFEKLNSYYLKAPWNPDNVSAILSFEPRVKAFDAVFEVFSLQGKKIGTFGPSFANLNLKNGVYILRLRQNGEVTTKLLKIVK